MERYGNDIRNQLHNFFNHRQVNIIITCVLIFVSLYIGIVACLGQNIIHPLADITKTSFTNNAVNEFVQTTMSLFMVVALGLLVGRIFYYIHLPPLFGALLLGIALKNIPVINELLYINSYWDFCVRKLAFILIMVRAAVAINTETVKKTPVVLLSLGVLTTIAEAAAICIASHCIFGFPLPIAIIFGFLLAATSPAVTVPSMLNLQNKNLGTDKGIPSLILAAASIDNLVTIVGYTISVGIVFSNEPIFETIIRTVGEIVVSAIVGLLLGYVLWWFPRRLDTYTYLGRTVLLLSLSVALVFGTLAVGCDFAGTIAVMVMCITATKRWKIDNEKKTHCEERTFGLLWNLVLLPALFLLIGMKFDLLQLTGTSVLVGLAILGIGVAVRMLAVLFFTMCSGLKFREQLIFVFSFFPKATVQAALAPSIVAICIGKEEYEPWAWMVLNSCVVAIIITAPLGQLFLDLCGPCLLKSKFVQTVHIGPEDTYMRSQKVDEEPEQGTQGTITFKTFKSIYQQQEKQQQQQNGFDGYPTVYQTPNFGTPVIGQNVSNGQRYESYPPEKYMYGYQSHQKGPIPAMPQSSPPQIEKRNNGYHF